MHLITSGTNGARPTGLDAPSIDNQGSWRRTRGDSLGNYSETAGGLAGRTLMWAAVNPGLLFQETSRGLIGRMTSLACARHKERRHDAASGTPSVSRAARAPVRRGLPATWAWYIAVVNRSGSAMPLSASRHGYSCGDASRTPSTSKMHDVSTVIAVPRLAMMFAPCCRIRIACTICGRAGGDSLGNDPDSLRRKPSQWRSIRRWLDFLQGCARNRGC